MNVEKSQQRTVGLCFVLCLLIFYIIINKKEDIVHEKVHGHECVDLGLSVKWATCNVGASSPEDHGDYYAWGEIDTKSTYDWNTYKWRSYSFFTFSKYCTISSYGTVDNKTELEPTDDVVQMKWGGGWRMPTVAEMIELRNNCTWKWVTQNGINGVKVTGPNGNSIFLPAGEFISSTNPLGNGDSYGRYWSSSLDATDSSSAWRMSISSDDVDVNAFSRYVGQFVRPVCP